MTTPTALGFPSSFSFPGVVANYEPKDAPGAAGGTVLPDPLAMCREVARVSNSNGRGGNNGIVVDYYEHDRGWWSTCGYDCPVPVFKVNP